MDNVKNSINRLQVVGTLLETNMEIVENADVTLRGNGVEKKVKCKQIAKKEFKNPMFLIQSNGMDIGVDFFAVNEKKLDENGNVVDNPRYKSFETVYNTYIPKSSCANGETPTRVKVDGTLRANEYVDKNSFEFKSFMGINGFQITSTSVPEDDIAEGELSGVIHTINHETKGEDGDETGRLKVCMYTFDNQGNTTPANFIVESDLADAFEDLYELGDSVKLYFEVNMRQVGQKKTTSGGFGRRESNMVSGYTVTEYSIFRGDNPFEEENEYYISVEQVKQALAERDIMIANKINEKKAEGGKSAPSKAFGNPATSSNNTQSSARVNPFA